MKKYRKRGLFDFHYYGNYEYICELDYITKLNFRPIMNKCKAYFFALFATGMLGISATAASVNQELLPEIKLPNGTGNEVVHTLSDNGAWGLVTNAVDNNDGNAHSNGGWLVDISTMKKTAITHRSDFAVLNDVTDDGNIIVGHAANRPAYYDVKKSEWVEMLLPSGETQGQLMAVTPDGKLAVGVFTSSADLYYANPCLYDLSTKTVIPTPGLPVKDMQNEISNQRVFSGISADGRYILGNISQSVMFPASMCSFVYDRMTSSYRIIGFTENLEATPVDGNGVWKADYAGTFFVDWSKLSDNGKWATGASYFIRGDEEYRHGFIYNVETGAYTPYDSKGEDDVVGQTVTDDGIVLAATPAENPAANAYIRYGKYYYPITEIMSQVYGIKLSEKTGAENSGRPIAASSDGRTIVLMTYVGESYVLKFKEPLDEICSRVNLLGNYMVTPAQGITISYLSQLSLRFDREIHLNNVASAIKVLDSEGKTVAAASVANVTGSTLNFTFVPVALEEGKSYRVVIPAGMVTVEGDNAIKNERIELSYKGRNNGPVKILGTFPENGAVFSRIDASTNPIMMLADATVKVGDNKTALLYREGEPDALAPLYPVADDDYVYLCPLTTQYLFKDVNYRVEIPSGLITDMAGFGDNEAMTLNYTGNYVREVSSDDRYIFRGTCDNLNDFMLYDGDRNTPVAEMAAWDFTDNMPWMYAYDDDAETFNSAFASHSMYVPAGKSDDWLVTPQLFIPDDQCYLSFKSQSYRAAKQDRLKVYIYESEVVYGDLTASTVELMRGGTLVYDEMQSPGANENKLEGDWKENVIDLARYSGKSIYIAFVNDNEDQSAVFVDDIEVVHDLKMLVTIETSEVVVARKEISVRGNVTVASDLDTFNNARIELRLADGTLFDSVEKKGLNLAKGDVFNFEFSKPLPLTVGVVNNFSVAVTLDDESTVVNRTVKDLEFEVTKRVVLEEYTGTTCNNCPLGIVAIENLQSIYGDRFIPITIRTYGGDRLGSGLGEYTSFLGLNAAPTGRINRGEVSSPMISVNGDYRFSGKDVVTTDGTDSSTWLDVVQREMSQSAEAEISLEVNYDDATGLITVPCKVRPALNLENQNIFLFGVIVEDNLVSGQGNGFSGIEDPDLGEWGKGGAYGSAYVYPYSFKDVARGVVGVTYNGTGGLIPRSLESGKTYEAVLTTTLPTYVENYNAARMIVMMIDGNTGRVLNAAQANIGDYSLSIDRVEAEVSAGVLDVDCVDGEIVVTGAGEVAVTVCDIAGKVLASGYGNDVVTVALNGYNGVVVVKCVAASSTVVKKIIVK